MRLKSILFSSVFAICLLTAACPAPCEIQDDQVPSVYNDLKPVTDALENYKKAENKYPQKLDELAPRFLPSIPQKLGGRGFSYILQSAEKYTIRIDAPNGGTYSGSCFSDDIEDRWKKLKNK